MRWLCTLVVVLCVSTSSALEDLPWWKTAVFYQVYPRSFKDSDGDGVGDLKGITQAADYFKEIGLDAIWLSPINTSPMVDFGYDISDFYGIDPIFGTMDDFDALVRKLRELDVKLILDFVPNHTSDQHEWFQKSVNNKTNPDYTDFYVWRDPKYDENGTRVPPNNWISVFGGSAWEWREERQQYYLHQFTVSQPELNYRDPTVCGNVTDVIEFWLNKGVDGFRIDAAKHLYENASFLDEPPVPGTSGDTYLTLQHIYETNQPETHTVLLYWADLVYQKVLQDNRTRAIFLEVYSDIPTAVSYYGEGNQNLEFPFNFNLLRSNQSSRPIFLKEMIDSWMALMPGGAVANWVISNHDVPRVTDRCGLETVDAMTLLTGVLPGIKVVYYGEEIGMQNTFITWDQTMDPSGRNGGPYHYLETSRDAGRTPMQWDDSVSAGFSTNKTTWLPVNPNYWWLNVEAQKTAETSHLKVFQALAEARKDPVLQRGDLNVTVPDDDTLVVIRSYNSSYFVLIVNMGSEFKTFTSQNFFAGLRLDTDMTVVVGSLNSGYQPGVNFRVGSLSVSLRPQAAILLKTSSTTAENSPGSRLIIASFLLFFSLFTILIHTTISSEGTY